MNLKEAPPNRPVGEIKLTERHGFGAPPRMIFEWVTLACGPQMTTTSMVHDVVEQLCRVVVQRVGRKERSLEAKREDQNSPIPKSLFHTSMVATASRRAGD